MSSLGLVGCTGTPTADLADLSGAGVRVAAAHPFDEVSGRDAPARIVVDVSYSWVDFRDNHDATCAVLTDAIAASFNGVPLTLTVPGGIYDEDIDDCVEPRFEGDVVLAIDGPRELVLGDATHIIRASYERGDLDPRHATLLSHDGWTFAPGAVVTFAWSHQQDMVFPRFEAWLEMISSPQTATLIERDQVEASDGTITVRIPSPPPQTGAMLLNVISLGGYIPQSGSAEVCSGAMDCTFSTPLGYRHLMTITEN